ncbi:MAG: hypothetical protein SPJ32_04660 [Oscillospiraceae bacterium]|nr:hypothetical protein [Subdoligranulum sp.]MDY5923308.1 hypothetical protein [Oscillospiraceae bacterium]
MRIASSRVKVTGDDDPKTQTRVFVVQELVCRSRRCPNFGRVVEQNCVQTYPQEE